MYPVDENGIPGAMGDDRFFDGGDSAAIVGTLICLGADPMPLSNFIGSGAPIRHPDVTKWYGQTNRFSRDQLIPLICIGPMLGKIRLDDFFALEQIFHWHKAKWFLTAWNTKPNFVMDGPTKFPDICGPEVWALWIRYAKPWWGYPLLYLLDIQTFIGAIQWRWFPKNQLCRNHMLVSLAMKTWPTVWSWLVNKINDWDALIKMWREHCYRAYEYNTADFFFRAAIDPEWKFKIEEQIYKTKV